MTVIHYDSLHYNIQSLHSLCKIKTHHYRWPCSDVYVTVSFHNAILQVLWPTVKFQKWQPHFNTGVKTLNYCSVCLQNTTYSQNYSAILTKLPLIKVLCFVYSCFAECALEVLSCPLNISVFGLVMLCFWGHYFQYIKTLFFISVYYVLVLVCCFISRSGNTFIPLSLW